MSCVITLQKGAGYIERIVVLYVLTNKNKEELYERKTQTVGRRIDKKKK